MSTARGLPVDGSTHNLTLEQKASLKEAWKHLFELIDNAPKIGSAENELSPRTEPKGMTDEEREIFKAQQEARASQAALARFGSVELLEALWQAVGIESPDSIMLRFLRARKFKVEQGVAMFITAIQWRKENNVKNICEKGEEGMTSADGFIRQMTSGKTYTHGTDRFGRPILYVHVAKHRTFDQDAKALEDFIIFQMESVRYLLAAPVDKIVLLFDMTGFGIRNMDWRCILFIVKCLEAYYPESLHLIMIHNAPWVFQGIWKLLAPMLDPVVRAKVEMTKTGHELMVHIAPNHLIKELGGTSSWTWNYPPVVKSENILQADILGRERAQNERAALIDTFTQITRKWILSSDPILEKRRMVAGMKLKVQFFEFDRYARGRGAYDRMNLAGNGLIFFDYGSDETHDDEEEVIGYETSKEALESEVERLEKELRLI